MKGKAQLRITKSTETRFRTELPTGHRVMAIDGVSQFLIAGPTDHLWTDDYTGIIYLEDDEELSPFVEDKVDGRAGFRKICERLINILDHFDGNEQEIIGYRDYQEYLDHQEM